MCICRKVLWPFCLRGGFQGLRLTILGLVVAEVLLLCIGFPRQGLRPTQADSGLRVSLSRSLEFCEDRGLVPGTEL